MIVLVILLVGIISWMILFVKTRSWYNPTGLIILFLSAFLCLSNFSITGIFVPSITTQLIFIFFIISITFGGSLAYPSRLPSNDVIFSNDKLIKGLFFFVACPMMLFLFYVAMKIIVSEGYLLYIFKTRGAEEGEKLLFGDGYLRMINNYLVIPIIYSGIFVGAALFFVSGKKLVFIISIILLSIYTFILSARGGFLMILLVSSYSYFLINKLKTADFRFRSIKYVARIVLFIIVGGIIYVTAFRAKSSFTVIDTLAHYGISYHTLGFTMFDLALHDTNSPLNNSIAFGRASVGLPDQILEILSRRVDSEGIRSVSRNLIREMDQQILVGYQDYRPEGLYLANAFYTLLYPLYLDFRLPGIAFGGFGLGFFLTRFFISWKRDTSNIYAFTMMLILLYVGYNSLFMPLIVRNIFWPFILISWVVLKVQFPKVSLRLK